MTTQEIFDQILKLYYDKDNDVIDLHNELFRLLATKLRKGEAPPRFAGPSPLVEIPLENGKRRMIQTRFILGGAETEYVIESASENNLAQWYFVEGDPVTNMEIARWALNPF
jgi:hypothetical protein